MYLLSFLNDYLENNINTFFITCRWYKIFHIFLSEITLDV